MSTATTHRYDTSRYRAPAGGADTDTELNHAALVGELASELAHAANHRAAPAQGGRR